MKNPPRLLFSLIIASYGFVAGIASAGTVITTNLPSGTTIVNIDSRADGAGAFSSDSAQSFWYQPTPTAPSVTLPAGTYQFRVIDPSDASTLYPNLTSSQRDQIYTGWTFNSPWSENYLVFKSSALSNPNEFQLFDAALDPAVTLYGSAAAAYSGTIANGYYNKIRLAPPGRAGTATCDYEGLYTLSATTTLLFVIPDNGLSDNTGGVSVVVTAVPNPPSSQLQNISTRLRVLTDPDALIGGTIIQGSQSKKVLFRALGPTLADPPFNIPDTLADPTMELHMTDSTGHDTLLQTNDNWKINDQTGKSQQAAISATGKAPPKDLESAILMTLAAGNYTAIVRGKNNGVGVGIVEAYDVSPAANSKLVNISSRGFVDTGNNVMIGGVVLGPFDAAGSKILVRALGPTLGQFGVSNFLADPTIELHNCDGALVASNDDWQSDPESSQIPANKKPPNAKESALYRTLLPSNYTAIVRGKNNATGVALVEVYYSP